MEIKLPIYVDCFTDGNSDKISFLKENFNGYNLNETTNYLIKIGLYKAHSSLLDFRLPLLENQTIHRLSDWTRLVDLKKDNVSLFYYPIAWHWWLKESSKDELSKVISIPNIIIKKIRQNKCKILLHNSRESWPVSYWEEEIQKILSIYPAIKKNDFIISCNNLDDFSKYGLKNVITLGDIDKSYLFDTKDLSYTDYIYTIEKMILNKQSRKYKILCMMRRPNTVRWALSTALAEYKIKNKGLVSFVVDLYEDTQNEMPEKISKDYWKNMNERINNLTDDFLHRSQLLNFEKMFPNCVDDFNKYKKHYPFLIEDDFNPLLNQLYQDKAIWKFYESYIQIVTETYFEHKTISISEKIWKPIFYMQPFILVGSPYTLKNLKELGFRTFDKWIDESYDEIEDPIKRFNHIVEVIKEFCNKPQVDLDNTMIEMLPVLRNNSFLLLTMQKNYVKNYVTRIMNA